MKSVKKKKTHPKNPKNNKKTQKQQQQKTTTKNQNKNHQKTPKPKPPQQPHVSKQTKKHNTATPLLWGKDWSYKATGELRAEFLVASSKQSLATFRNEHSFQLNNWKAVANNF